MKTETLVGYRVIAQNEGVDLGKVRQVIFDAVKGRAAALLLGEKDLFGLVDAQVVAWDEIQQIGENAIIVKSAESRRKAGEMPEIVTLLEQRHLIPGAKLYTEDGTGLGHIKDVLFEANGTITDYEISGGLIEDTLRGTRFMAAQYPLRIGEEVVFVEPRAAKELKTSPPDYNAHLDAVKQQVSETLSPEAISRTTQQLQKSLDSAAGKFKETWKNEGKPPENNE